MTKTTKKLFYGILGMVLATMVLSAALPSSAKADGNFKGCLVNTVLVDNNGSRLIVTCSNDTNNYYTNPGGSCSASSADAVKLWESMAMSAFLSGKKVTIWYQSGGTCTVRNIVSVQVTN